MVVRVERRLKGLVFGRSTLEVRVGLVVIAPLRPLDDLEAIC